MVEMQAPPKAATVAVVILTYNSAKEIGACVTSVVAQADVDLQVIVVDNSSTDATAKVLPPHRNLTFVQRDDNGGFAAGVNDGLAKVGPQADFVLVLNPDTLLPQTDCLSRLLRVFSSETVGMVSARLDLADGTLDHACFRREPSVRNALAYFAGYRLQNGTDYSEGRLPASPTSVDAVSGAFMLMRASALREVGPFDTRFWMYGEDLDLCRRFRTAGFSVVVDPGVHVLHLKGRSAPARPWWLTRVFHRSMWLYYLKHHPSDSVVTKAAVTGGILLRCLYVGAKNLGGRPRTDKPTDRGSA